MKLRAQTNTFGVPQQHPKLLSSQAALSPPFKGLPLLRTSSPASGRATESELTSAPPARLVLTCPVQFDGPLIEEDKFAFPVVNGGLSVKLVHLRHLTPALLIFYSHGQEQRFQLLRGPVGSIPFCPAKQKQRWVAVTGVGVGTMMTVTRTHFSCCKEAQG